MPSPTTRILAFAIVIAALTRLLPHPPNFSPVMALALFSGAALRDWRLALLVPLAAMLMADLWLGFHATMVFVYLGMALTVGAGRWLGARRRPRLLLAAGMAGASLFFLVSNAGVWLTQDLYPATGAGLAACYLAALPFFHQTLLATLVYGALLFGMEHWLAVRSDRHTALV
ncbi:MAG: DUF6580 family putative transport protein [Gammaproteobacteria bacterium]